MYMISEVEKYWGFNPFEGRVVRVPANQYVPEIWNEPDDVYYHGYWINEGWLNLHREELGREFRFPEITDPKNREYLDRIQNTNSVAVHIRQGDYVALGWAMKPQDYRKLLVTFAKRFPGRWELFVFSDDIPWCKKHQREMGFGMFQSVTYVEGNVQGRNYLDMQLMSCCKAMVMSNSAFCYLAALLSSKSERRHFVNPTSRGLSF